MRINKLLKRRYLNAINNQLNEATRIADKTYEDIIKSDELEKEIANILITDEDKKNIRLFLDAEKEYEEALNKAVQNTREDSLQGTLLAKICTQQKTNKEEKKLIDILTERDRFEDNTTSLKVSVKILDNAINNPTKIAATTVELDRLLNLKKVKKIRLMGRDNLIKYLAYSYHVGIEREIHINELSESLQESVLSAIDMRSKTRASADNIQTMATKIADTATTDKALQENKACWMLAVADEYFKRDFEDAIEEEKRRKLQREELRKRARELAAQRRKEKLEQLKNNPELQKNAEVKEPSDLLGDAALIKSLKVISDRNKSNE